MSTKHKQLSPEVEQALVDLKDRGFAPVEAIKTIYEIYGLSLAEAKPALAGSTAWAREGAAADRLHTNVLGVLAKEQEQ